MTYIPKLGSAAAIYAIFNACTAAAPLLLLPVYTSWLSPDEFGSLSLFNTLVALAAPVVSIGASAAVQRRFFDLDKEGFSCYIRTAIVVISMFGILLSMITLVLSYCKKTFFGISSEWLNVAVAVAMAISIQQLVLAIWQAEQRFKDYIRFQVMYLLLLAGLPILFVMVFKFGLLGAIAGMSIGNGIAGIFLLLKLSVEGRLIGRIDRNHVNHLLRFGSPLLPHLLAGWAIAMFDRFLIASYWGLAAVGIYSFAFQIAQVLNLLSGSFNQAFTPWLYHALSRGTVSDGTSSNKVIKYYSAVMIFAGIGVFVALYLLVPTIAPHYTSSLQVAPWLIAGFTFNALYRIASTFQMYAERTYEIAIATVTSGIVSIILNVLLIKKYGPVAAGWSCSFGFGILFFWSAYRAIGVRQLAFEVHK